MHLNSESVQNQVLSLNHVDTIKKIPSILKSSAHCHNTPDSTRHLSTYPYRIVCILLSGNTVHFSEYLRHLFHWFHV